jgi:hypothetical protein
MAIAHCDAGGAREAFVFSETLAIERLDDRAGEQRQVGIEQKIEGLRGGAFAVVAENGNLRTAGDAIRGAGVSCGCFSRSELARSIARRISPSSISARTSQANAESNGRTKTEKRRRRAGSKVTSFQFCIEPPKALPYKVYG